MPTPEEQQRALAEQAYQAWAGAPMIPMLADQDPLAAQNDQLAAQAQQDLAMAAAGPPAPPVAPQPTFVDPAAVSSMPEGPMSAPPEQMSPQQQLAANAFRTWSPPTTADQGGGLADWAPPAGVAGPPAPPPTSPHVIQMDPQAVTAPAPATGGTGGQAARAPSLMDQQGAMAGASRDAAEQARIDADISNDIQAENLVMQGEQQAANAQQMAEAARTQQADLEEAGRVANERRAVKEAVSTDLTQQYKTLNDEAAAVEVRDRRGTAQRVMGALAIALGGLADQTNLVAGLNMGLNVQTHNADRALAIVNESIDRDLAIQRANLTNKRDSAAAKYSELGIAQAAIKDVDAQEALAKAALMDKYALGLDAIKAQGMSETATTTAAISAEKLRGDAKALRAQALEQSAAKEEERYLAMQVQAERDRNAAAAARGRGQSPMVAELIDKERRGIITEDEMKRLNGLRKGAKDAAPDDATKKMSDGDKKLARLAAGAQPAVEALLPYLAQDKDVPYFGVRGVASEGSLIERATPNALIPDENIDFRNSVDAVTNVLLRDESGAALPPGEITAKKKAWGIESGSHGISKEGVRRILYEYAARKANGSLPPSIDEQPIAEAQP